MMNSSRTEGGAQGESLDEAVAAAAADLDAREVPAPAALLLLGTGAEAWAEFLGDGLEIPLGELPGVPDPWGGAVLFAGVRDGVPLWALEDHGTDPAGELACTDWARAFPVWLAAKAGAQVMVHASAGTAPSRDAQAPPLGSLLLASDHINVSGHSPLLGLGPSRLGPLFPDLSRLHHVGLRAAARSRAERAGLLVLEGVVACTAGPALETPSELSLLARLGADACVQGLAEPLLACGHAGLACLALVCIVQTSDQDAEVSPLLELAEELGPRLDGLLLDLVPDVGLAARAHQSETPS